MSDITIHPLPASQAASRIGELSDVLIGCVEGGASVSFMAPMERETADAFWRGVAVRVERGEAVLVVAESEGRIVGTAMLVTGLPENQPHRADVAKVLVSPAMRGQGVGERLMGAIEDAARDAGRTLLVLDTVPGTAADRLYRRTGWQEVGRVPSFALWPDGRACDTMFFYKNLG